MAKRQASESIFDGKLADGIDGLELIEIEMNPVLLSGMTRVIRTKKGATLARIFIEPELSKEKRELFIATELTHLDDRPLFTGSTGAQLKAFFAAIEAPIGSKPEVSLSRA